MTIPMSLLITPVFDASKYTAGAQQKVAADKAMTASAQAVGAAQTQTDTKISQAGDVLARLSRQYVEGYASAQKMQSAVNSLSRGIEMGKITMAQSEPILEGIFRKYGQLGDGAQFAAKGQYEFAAAITNTTARLTAQKAAADAAAASTGKVTTAANQNHRGASNFSASNMAFQMQDVAMMAAMGQSPMTTALQQGPQIAMVMQQGGGLAALGAGLASLINPTMLITVGLVAATSAVIQFAMKGKDGAKTLDEAMKAHSETLRLLKDQYGDLGEAVKTVGNAGGLSFTEASARNAQTLLQAQIREKTSPFLETIGGVGWMEGLFGNGGGVERLRNLSGEQKQFSEPMDALIKSAKSGKTDIAAFNAEVERLFSQFAGSSENPAALRVTADAVLLLGSNAFEVSGKFAPFADAINRLKVEAADGKPNLAAFNAEVERIGRVNGLQKLADEAIIAGKEIVGLADKAAELERILQRIDREDTRPGLSDRRDLGRYVANRSVQLQAENERFAAEQQMARARTNAERLAAIEAQVRARARQEGDTGGGLQARVDRALEAERNRQLMEERDARVERERAQQRSIESAQQEISLIGATAGEVARLGYQYAEIARLREEAARRGEQASESDIAKIKQTAEELGKLADIAARLKLNRDLSFEFDQMFRTPLEKGIASRLKGAGLEVDLNSYEAQKMREMEAFAAQKDIALSFLNTFKSTLLSNGGDIGDAFGKAILAALMNSLDKQLSSLFDKFATMFASAMTGIVPSFGFAPNMTASQFFGAGAPVAANSNVNPALGNVGSTIDFMRAAGNLDMLRYREAIASIESMGSGGYSAIGPTHPKYGRALGRYQVMEANVGPWSEAALGRRIGADEFMANPRLQDKIFDHRFGGYVDKYGESGAASMWFTGRPNAPHARDVLGTSGSVYVDKFNAQIKSMGDTAANSVKGLTSFNGSLTEMAGKITSPSGPLGGLFGTGLNNTTNFQNGRGGGLGALLGYGGGGAPQSGGGGFGGLLGMLLGFLPKLFGFAEGTENAPPGYAWVGERGPEIIKFRGGEQVVPNHRLGMGGTTFAPVFQVDARGSTMTRAEYESISRQQSERAVAMYHETLAQGGFGALQTRYSNQKA